MIILAYLDYCREHWILSLTFLLVGLFLLVVAVHDITQKKHSIVHNFPVVGHLRYWLESIGPEMRQYWVADDKDEAPFNRSERRWIYASAKGANSTFGFGTTEMLYQIGYPSSSTRRSRFPNPRPDMTAAIRRRWGV